MLQAIAARLLAQYGVYLLIAIGAVGGFAGYGIHKYNQGWRDAIAGVASRNSEAINAVRGAVSKVDDCSANGGFWDAVSGVCR
ncbi:hypothetical protein ACRQ5Q_24325 [Bradyrhizobium sp. PMVTL-01]|uniref:hypothetical protein n=1 Tax=Bradyrhizobium sp. PMVTL-01 TaxID=3434999 RepID=UPI003F6EEA98